MCLNTNLSSTWFGSREFTDVETPISSKKHGTLGKSISTFIKIWACLWGSVDTVVFFLYSGSKRILNSLYNRAEIEMTQQMEMNPPMHVGLIYSGDVDFLK